MTVSGNMPRQLSLTGKEMTMPDDNGGGGINALLGAVVFVLLIAVIALSFVVFEAGVGRQTAESKVPEAHSPG